MPTTPQSPAGPQGVGVGGEQPSPFDLLVGVPVGSRVLLELPAPPAVFGLAAGLRLAGAVGAAGLEAGAFGAGLLVNRHGEPSLSPSEFRSG